MSAYILKKDHFDSLLTFARFGDGGKETVRGYGHGRHYKRIEWTRTKIGDDKICNTLGNMLLAQNHLSVSDRYADVDPLAGFKEYSFKTLQCLYSLPGEVCALMITEACDCYDYQACETDDYYDTEAARFIDAIRNAALGQLQKALNGLGWNITADKIKKYKNQ